MDELDYKAIESVNNILQDILIKDADNKINKINNKLEDKKYELKISEEYYNLFL